MDRVGGAFESITGTGGNTNQSPSRSSTATGTQPQQQPSGTTTTTDTGTSATGILGTLSDKLGSVTGAGANGPDEKTETQGGVESENPTTATDPLNVSHAKDEQIGDFIRHQYRSSTGDGVEEKKK